VPKKIKNESARDAAPLDAVASAPPAAETVKQSAKSRPAPAKRASSKTAAKKKTTPRAKSSAKQSSKSPKAIEPSDADVQLRAYFIAERRSQLGLPGDQANDWLEAKRQLVEEARGKES
jgi:hypothetical protein